MLCPDNMSKLKTWGPGPETKGAQGYVAGSGTTKFNDDLGVLPR